MELILFGLFILCSVIIGYKMGKGEDLKLSVKKFQPIVRTDEQKENLIHKLRSKK